MEDGKTAAYNAFFVVITLDDFSAAFVTDSFDLCRLKDNIINLTARFIPSVVFRTTSTSTLLDDSISDIPSFSA